MWQKLENASTAWNKRTKKLKSGCVFYLISIHALINSHIIFIWPVLWQCLSDSGKWICVCVIQPERKQKQKHQLNKCHVDCEQYQIIVYMYSMWLVTASDVKLKNECIFIWLMWSLLEYIPFDIQFIDRNV